MMVLLALAVVTAVAVVALAQQQVAEMVAQVHLVL
jgi:hypothetical protein